MNVLAINTSDMCWNGWKSTCARQQLEASVMNVFQVNGTGNLALHSRIDHRSTVSWFIPMLVDQCQWSCFEVQRTKRVSRTIAASFLQVKVRCFQVFMHLPEWSETAGHRVNLFRCNGGKEFTRDKVRHVLSDRGITLLLSVPYVLERNGVAERETVQL